MNQTFFLNIAGFVIKIVFDKSAWTIVKHSTILQIRNYYKDLIIKPQLASHIDHTIIFRQKKSNDAFIKNKKYYINIFKQVSKHLTISYYIIGMFEFQILMKNVLQELLARTDGIIVHASASLINRQAYLFLGESGAGKSTIVHLLAERFRPLTDDLGIIRRQGKGFAFYQGSFLTKDITVQFSSERYYIGKIFFLRKSPSFRVQKIKNRQIILPQYLRQILPEKQRANKQVNIALDLFAQFNEFYYLFFAKDPDKLIRLLEKNV